MKDFESLLNKILTYTPPTKEEIEAARKRLDEERTIKTARLRARADGWAKAAIGKFIKVKTGRNEYVTGTITKCEVAGIRNNPRSIIVQFRVYVGQPPYQHSVIVEKLPQ